MSLFSDWQAFAEMDRPGQQGQMFWANYFSAEQSNYEKILAEPNKVISGTFSDLAKSYDMDNLIFMGFLDGINTSLKKELDLESIEENTEIELNIDLPKLYFNMLNAKADWLFNLPAWDDILSPEERREITKDWRASKQATSTKKVGRNDPCPCGSGKKYKLCCMLNEA